MHWLHLFKKLHKRISFSFIYYSSFFATDNPFCFNIQSQLLWHQYTFLSFQFPILNSQWLADQWQIFSINKLNPALISQDYASSIMINNRLLSLRLSPDVVLPGTEKNYWKNHSLWLNFNNSLTLTEQTQSNTSLLLIFLKPTK